MISFKNKKIQSFILPADTCINGHGHVSCSVGWGVRSSLPSQDVLVKIDTSGLKGLTKLSSLNDEDAIDVLGVEA